MFEQMSKQATSACPITPPSKPRKKPENPEEEKKEKEQEKKATEAARQANKVAQSKDLPKYKDHENFIETSKAVYEITDELGAGSFGAVYQVTRRSDKKQFAMKCESVHVKKAVMTHEATVLLALALLKSPHFVDLVDQGSIPQRFLFLVLKLVGPNLWDVRGRLHEKRYRLATTLRIAEQTLAALRDLHRVGILHRDIKPPNFAIGREEDNSLHTVFVLDFGLCRKIAYKGVDLRTPRKECAFRGTPRYAALAAHDGEELSRKDDLEAWWYMIAELIIFELPWKCFKGTDREAMRKEKIRLRKEEGYMKTLFRTCCYEQMSIILAYLDKLEYTSIPDYDFVFHHVQNAALVNGISPRTPPDWDEKNEYHGPIYKTGQSYICKALEMEEKEEVNYLDTPTTITYPQRPPAPDPQEAKDAEIAARLAENLWIQRNDVMEMCISCIGELKKCCVILNLSAKCDERLGVPYCHGKTEKHQLGSRLGTSDNLKAAITLLDDNVIQAEVTVKYPKAVGGYYRAVAQPDVQWKLQQLQDLGNHIARVTISLCDLKEEVMLLRGNADTLEQFTESTGKRILEELKSTMNELSLARNTIMLPRKRSLLELCYFPPTRKFVPPLPQDQLISFYISSCRLVCASYQMVPKTVHPQGLSVFMAECQLPHLDEVIKHLNSVMGSIQRLITYFSATFG